MGDLHAVVFAGDLSFEQHPLHLGAGAGNSQLSDWTWKINWLSQAKAWRKFVQDGKSGDWAMFVESDTIFQNEFGHDFCEVWDSIDLKDRQLTFFNSWWINFSKFTSIIK